MITDNAVYSDRVTINAPAGVVWDVLLDFENYAEWNAFCPEIKTESLARGSALDMKIYLGNGLVRQVEYVSKEEPERCISWRMANQPEDPVHAVRSQYIELQDEKTCIYWTVDEFSGPGMAAMMDQMAEAVEIGFNRCAYGLKARAESLYAAVRNGAG